MGWQGNASVRRVIRREWGGIDLDIKPDGMDWRWTSVPAEQAKEALAVGIAGITGGWKLWVELSDDPNSNVLVVFGLTDAPND